MLFDVLRHRNQLIHTVYLNMKIKKGKKNSENFTLCYLPL